LRTAEDTLFLEYTIDYAPEWLTPNQLAYANMVNQIQTFGVPNYEPVAFNLMAITDPTDYRRALDSLTGEGTAAGQNFAMDSRGAFMSGALQNAGTQLNCGKSSGVMPEHCEQKTLWWSSVEGQFAETLGNYADGMTHTYNAASAKFGGMSLNVGATTLLDGELTLGWLFEDTKGSYTVPDRWTQGDLSQLNFAFTFGKRYENDIYIKGVASVGISDSDQVRYAMGNLVNGSFSTRSAGAQVEVGYNSASGLSPFASYRFDRQRRAAFSEDDTTWGNNYTAQTTFSRELTLGVEFDEVLDSGNGDIMRVFGRISGSTELATDRVVTGSSLAAPDFSYSVSGLSKSPARLNASLGIDYAVSNAATLRFEAEGYVSETKSFGALSISFNIRF